MGEDASFEKYLAEQDARNKELLGKYKVDQKVKLDMGDGELVTGLIREIYLDFNGGPIKEVYVDLDEDGAVTERILAEDILEIVEDPESVNTPSPDIEETPESIRSRDFDPDEDPPF